MTAVSVSGWAGNGFAHEACVFDDDDALRARMLPFLEEAMARGEATLVVAGERVRALVADTLVDGGGEPALLADSEEFWQGGAQTLAAYQESMRPLLEAGKPWRFIGEPTWLAGPGGEVWSRYEAVSNDAFADYPCYSLCLHDRRRLSPDLIECALRTHPLTWNGATVVASPDYQPTEAFLRSEEAPWTPRPEERDWAVVTRPAAARALVHQVLGDGHREEHVEDVVLAVHELVANALEAAGAAEVSHWRTRVGHAWEVSDDGIGMHKTSAGYAPPPSDVPTGRGLWIARSLADDAIVRPYGPGTAARLYFHTLPAGD